MWNRFKKRINLLAVAITGIFPLLTGSHQVENDANVMGDLPQPPTGYDWKFKEGKWGRMGILVIPGSIDPTEFERFEQGIIEWQEKYLD